MLKKTITFKDFNGESTKDDFYFNLTQAEVAEMELSAEGGMQEFIKRITKTRDQAKLVALFKELIMKSYGERSIDGKRFYKNDQIRADFAASGAYSELFMELATNTQSAIDFIVNVFPVDPEEARKAIESGAANKED